MEKYFCKFPPASPARCRKGQTKLKNRRFRRYADVSHSPGNMSTRPYTLVEKAAGFQSINGKLCFLENL